MIMIHVLFLVFIARCSDSSTEFPRDFLFGVATASYQIEGGWNANGKGENIWDNKVHSVPHYTKDDSTGDVACDSYNLYNEDIKLLTDLGVNFYRFSLSWSRLLPTGLRNRINPDGVRYYSALIDGLLQHRILPMVTLYHWDLPQPLQDLGGWTNPYVANYFVDYADVVFGLFAEKVPFWITFNEPIEVCETGYGEGENAPNVNSSGIGSYICGYSILRAHAGAYHLYKNKYKKGKVGITINSQWYEPKTNSSEDKEASERALQTELGWWAHPIFSKTGDYPQIMKDRVAKFSKAENFTRTRLTELSLGEVDYIRGTFDFFGLNHYTTNLASPKEEPVDTPPSYAKDVGVLKEQDQSWPSSAAQWLRSVPWGMRKILNWIKEEYNNPAVYITENGYADGGGTDDVERVKYYQGYLSELLKAIEEDGCNVKGYTAWSLMDNMEWRDGYTIKFGLYSVNFTDPERTRKEKTSAQFYKNLIKTRTIPK